MTLCSLYWDQIGTKMVVILETLSAERHSD